MSPLQERYKTGISCVYCASLNVVAQGTGYTCDNCGTSWGMRQLKQRKPLIVPILTLAKAA